MSLLKILLPKRHSEFKSPKILLIIIDNNDYCFY
jgi:hypothetical protein